ncbi:hypothetical protein [Vibrio gazogenes]|uniref:Uncharacterized protein n=1 Tax=Vibrio gazogenes DSM 21264 = NBRC 103151 TaxID=1123492 RepID=A0A1M4WC89_VIBGA|nr:hypothetical protein [Vibrio gazogenes]USP13246.1 hypothetical protein MKS89_12620 [Vibrio gazogenes]SHE78582.1 hypothetical protein SAMN02745781_00767 [Vibrio gazogenes DSM 21264] [Vibrio gazogenes DSM 21264 = NBRC 103151]SJN59238.1 hypothetical protein BQ6471_03382 [Vibrio gazogenes]
MPDQNIGQILQSFNNIESRIQEQHGMLRELTAKVKSLEAQNKQLVQMIHQLQSQALSPSPEQYGQSKAEFQEQVTRSLRSIEDKSKKAIELIKANGGKKRAWP